MISRHKADGLTPCRRSVPMTACAKSASRSCATETLTETGSARPLPAQAAISAQARSRTQTPSWRMSPVDSAIGMKSPGAISPKPG